MLNTSLNSILVLIMHGQLLRVNALSLMKTNILTKYAYLTEHHKRTVMDIMKYLLVTGVHGLAVKKTNIPNKNMKEDKHVGMVLIVQQLLISSVVMKTSLLKLVNQINVNTNSLYYHQQLVLTQLNLKIMNIILNCKKRFQFLNFFVMIVNFKFFK